MATRTLPAGPLRRIRVSRLWITSGADGPIIVDEKGRMSSHHDVRILGEARLVAREILGRGDPLRSCCIETTAALEVSP